MRPSPSSRPIPGQDVIHVPGLRCGRCPPGSAGVPPAPLSAAASPVSAACIDRQRRRGFPWAVLLRFTTKGPLPACNLPLTLRDLQPGIRLRAGRPRSRGGALRAARAVPNSARGSVDFLPVSASHVRPTSFKKLKITPPLRGSRRSRAEWRRLLRWGADAGVPQNAPVPLFSPDSRAGCNPCSRFTVWTMPTRERGRPARTIVRHGFTRLRRLHRPATAPWVSLGLAIAVHAQRHAACLERPTDAPRPPARNKVAGGTPAFPGGRPSGGPCSSEFCERLS